MIIDLVEAAWSFVMLCVTAGVGIGAGWLTYRLDKKRRQGLAWLVGFVAVGLFTQFREASVCCRMMTKMTDEWRRGNHKAAMDMLADEAQRREEKETEEEVRREERGW